MGVGHGAVHPVQGRIERAQAHGTRNVLKCQVRLTSPNSQPGTEHPISAQVGIDRQAPIHESGSVVELMGYKGERISSHAQRNRVVAPRSTAFRASRTASALS